MKNTTQLGSTLISKFKLPKAVWQTEDETKYVKSSWLTTVILFIENTCEEIINPFLEDSETTVGSGINIMYNSFFSDNKISNISKMPHGDIQVTAELLEIEESVFAFRIQIDSDGFILCSGLHTRTVLKREHL